jgi:cell shape-determining protein MreC
MAKKFSEDLIEFVAALGAKANSVENVESELEWYKRWYKEEADKVKAKQVEIDQLRDEIDQLRG